MNNYFAPHQGLTNYIPQIDTLRAIAVLSVIMYHLSPSIIPGGFCGVDIFFVISGYVVSASLERETKKSFLLYLETFYARRILRIMPALLFCLVITSLVANLFIPNSWLSDSSKQTGFYAFFGLSNFALIWSSDGYFSPRSDFNPFTHTWSLAVEEQFYLLFPFVFYVWARVQNQARVFHTLGNYILIILVIISLGYSWHETQNHPDQAFYLLPSRFWELGCGAFLFQLQFSEIIPTRLKVSTDWILAPSLIIIAAALIYSQRELFPYPWALTSVFGAFLFILGVSSENANKSYLANVLNNPLLVFTGKISYSLYLWHWPVYVILRWTTGLENIKHQALALALSIILAITSYYLIENPFRKNRFLLSQPKWKVIILGLSGVFLFWSLSQKIYAHHARLSLSVTKDEKSWYPNAISLEPAGSANHCKPKGSSEEVDGVSVSTITNTSCDQVQHQPQKLFVIGDSHVGAYAPILYTLAKEYGIDIYMYRKAGCGFLNLLKPTKSLMEDCQHFVSTSMLLIQQRATPKDVVFLASLRMQRLSDQWSVFQDPPESSKLSESEVTERSEALSEALNLIGIMSNSKFNIVIDAPKPVFKAPSFRCSDWFNSDNPVCRFGLSMEKAVLLDYRRPVMASLKKLSSTYPKLSVWDPFPLLCPGHICRAVDQGVPYFYDGDHLSGAGNQFIYNSFLTHLSQIGFLQQHN